MGLLDYFNEDYQEGRKQARILQNNPALMKQFISQSNAQNMAGPVSAAYGQAAQAEETAPYTQGEEDLFPGERPIEGLMDITQEAQAGTGLIGSAGNPEEQRYLEAHKALGTSGQAGGVAQQAALLEQMQNSVMQNYGGLSKQQDMNAAKLANPQLRRAESAIEYWQRDPEGYAGMKSKGTPLVNVNSKMRNSDQQISYDDKMAVAKSRRKYITDITSAGRNARGEMAKTDRMLDLLDTGTKTGFGQEWIVTAKQIAQTMGIDAKTASAEELQVLMGDLVMKRVSETKGAVSEKEMDLFRQYSANFGKSPEGNKAILNFYKSMLNRSKDMSGMVRSWRKDGMGSAEIEEKLFQYQDENPLTIGEPKQKRKPISEMTSEERQARIKELESR